MMEQAQKIRTLMATAAATAALAAPVAVARAEPASTTPEPTPGATLEAPTLPGEASDSVEQGDALVPPPAPATQAPPPSGGAGSGGTEAGVPETAEAEGPEVSTEAGATP